MWQHISNLNIVGSWQFVALAKVANASWLMLTLLTLANAKNKIASLC